MSKYDPLRDYLMRQRLRELTLSLREIEEIIGARLPRSCELPQWWANSTNRNKRRPQREAWRAARYDAFLIRGADKVTFRKV